MKQGNRKIFMPGLDWVICSINNMLMYLEINYLVNPNNNLLSIILINFRGTK